VSIRILDRKVGAKLHIVCLDDDPTDAGNRIACIHHKVQNSGFELRRIEARQAEIGVQTGNEFDFFAGPLDKQLVELGDQPVEIDGDRTHDLAAREHQQLLDQTRGAFNRRTSAVGATDHTHLIVRCE
jgi:hypothetical protein